MLKRQGTAQPVERGSRGGGWGGCCFSPGDVVRRIRRPAELGIELCALRLHNFPGSPLQIFPEALRRQLPLVQWRPVYRVPSRHAWRRPTLLVRVRDACLSNGSEA